MSGKKSDWCVYILRCSDDSLYTGITNDVLKRINMHLNNKGAKYFRGRSPVALAYLENGHGRSSASRKEAQIKALNRQQKLDLIASDENQAGLYQDHLDF